MIPDPTFVLYSLPATINSSPTDVNYLTVNAEFDYKIYEIITL